MDRPLELSWFLVCLRLGTTQYFPGPDFSQGCTVPSDNYEPPMVLPPYLCHLVVRESARALGLLQPYAPMPNYDQLQQSASRAVNPTFTNPCNPQMIAGRAIECSKLETPPMQPPIQPARFVDCSQQLSGPPGGGRAVECNPPLQASRAVDCKLLPNMPDCNTYAPSAPPPPQPQLQPTRRLLECSQIPIPAGRFVGCAPIIQDAEPVSPPPCHPFCNTLCAGCQPNSEASSPRAAEDAMVGIDQGGRAVNGSPSPPQYSYNLIPVNLKLKTPGAEDQPTQLLLLQLNSDAKKLENKETQRPNEGRATHYLD